jgi:hypothetical protein
MYCAAAGLAIAALAIRHAKAAVVNFIMSSLPAAPAPLCLEKLPAHKGARLHRASLWTRGNELSLNRPFWLRPPAPARGTAGRKML